MEQPDLFTQVREAKREKLRARGWRQEGILFWARPDEDGGGHVTEDEAFSFLERLEKSS